MAQTKLTNPNIYSSVNPRHIKPNLIHQKNALRTFLQNHPDTIFNSQSLATATGYSNKKTCVGCENPCFPIKIPVIFLGIITSIMIMKWATIKIMMIIHKQRKMKK